MVDRVDAETCSSQRGDLIPGLRCFNHTPRAFGLLLSTKINLTASYLHANLRWPAAFRVCIISNDNCAVRPYQQRRPVRQTNLCASVGLCLNCITSIELNLRTRHERLPAG